MTHPPHTPKPHYAPQPADITPLSQIGRPKLPRWNAKPRTKPISSAPLTKLEYQIYKSGLFDYEVAYQIGVVYPRISDWKAGRRPIPPKHLISMAKLFGCSPSDLLGNVDPGVNIDSIDSDID